MHSAPLFCYARHVAPSDQRLLHSLSRMPFIDTRGTASRASWRTCCMPTQTRFRTGAVMSKMAGGGVVGVLAVGRRVPVHPITPRPWPSRSAVVRQPHAVARPAVRRGPPKPPTQGAPGCARVPTAAADHPCGTGRRGCRARDEGQLPGAVRGGRAGHRLPALQHRPSGDYLAEGDGDFESPSPVTLSQEQIAEAVNVPRRRYPTGLRTSPI